MTSRRSTAGRPRRKPGWRVCRSTRTATSTSSTPTTPPTGVCTFGLEDIRHRDPSDLPKAKYLFILNRNENIIPAVAKLKPDAGGVLLHAGRDQGHVGRRCCRGGQEPAGPGRPTRSGSRATRRRQLAEGRAQGRAVRNYLSTLQTAKKSTGRKPKRTSEEIQADIDAEPDPAKRVELIQKRLDVEDHLASEAQAPDMERLQAAFVEVAKPYAERKGLSYSAFRELGVPAAVLKEAGIPRSSRAG